MPPAKPKSHNHDDDLLAQLGDLGVESFSPVSPPGGGPSSPHSAVLVDDPLADLENLAKKGPLPVPASNPSQRAGSTPRRSVDTAAPRAASPGAGAGGSYASPNASKRGSSLTGNTSREGQKGDKSAGGATTITAAAAADGGRGATGASGSGSSWWGGWVATATATATAVARQAEAAVKEIQHSEEAHRWAEQVKGNVGVLKGLGDELTSRALPTFTTILNTLAPQISRHEVVRIHVTHPMVGYPPLEPTVHSTFSRVMAQVEGGELEVLPRARTDPHSTTTSKAKKGGRRSSSNPARPESAQGWSDGSWWKSNDFASTAVRRVMNPLPGGVGEGAKRAKAEAVAFAKEYFGAVGSSLEQETRSGKPVPEGDDGDRASNIFLALQAVSYTEPRVLLSSPPAGRAEKGAAAPVDKSDEVVAFVVHLYDPRHGLAYGTVSQSFPKDWVDWLEHFPSSSSSPDSASSSSSSESDSDSDSDSDSESSASPSSPTFSARSEQPSDADEDDVEDGDDDEDGEGEGDGDGERNGKGGASPRTQKPSYHPAISPIIAAGGLDPRDWARDWIEDAVALAVGVLAQRYVASRMGVGAPDRRGDPNGGAGGRPGGRAEGREGGVGDGVVVKKVVSDGAVLEGAGEAARAL